MAAAAASAASTARGGHDGCLRKEALLVSLRQASLVLQDRDEVIDHDVVEMLASAWVDTKAIGFGEHELVLREDVEMLGASGRQDAAAFTTLPVKENHAIDRYCASGVQKHCVGERDILIEAGTEAHAETFEEVSTVRLVAGDGEQVEEREVITGNEDTGRQAGQELGAPADRLLAVPPDACVVVDEQLGK